RGAVVMVEGGAKQVPEPEILAGLKRAHQEIVAAIASIEALRDKVGVPKIAVAPPPDRSELAARVRAQAESRLASAVQIRAKPERYAAIAEGEKEVVDGFVTAFRNAPAQLDTLAAIEKRQSELRDLSGAVKEILHDLRSELMRKRILDEGTRIDGRRSDEIRPIACEVRALPRPHG